MRSISWFRLFKETRYLIAMIETTMFKIIPFLILFLFTCLAFSFASMALYHEGDEYVSYWQGTYRLAYGDFPDPAEDKAEQILFIIATLFLPLVLLNLLIAIISDIFDDI